MLLMLSGCVQAADELGERAAGVAAEKPASAAALPEVWLCAGDRIADMLDPEAEWPFVKQHLTGVKLYVGQLAASQRQPTGTGDKLRQLAGFLEAHDFQVVELGGCLDFAPMDDTAGEWSARHELAAIENFYAAGGKVDYLDLDGPIRRLLHPENRSDGRRSTMPTFPASAGHACTKDPGERSNAGRCPAQSPLKDIKARIPPEKPLAVMKSERDAAWVTICGKIAAAYAE